MRTKTKRKKNCLKVKNQGLNLEQLERFATCINANQQELMFVKAASAPHQSNFHLHNPAEFAEAVKCGAIFISVSCGNSVAWKWRLLMIIRSFLRSTDNYLGYWWKHCEVLLGYISPNNQKHHFSQCVLQHFVEFLLHHDVHILPP